MTEDVRRRIQLYSFFFGAFDPIHAKFYVNGVKKIPLDIQNYLSPLALALWICGDDMKRKNTIARCTYGFSQEFVELLQKVLLDKYNIHTQRHKGPKDGKKYPLLYVKTKSAPILKNLVCAYIVSLMSYKIRE